MKTLIRNAIPDDLDFLEHIENTCFLPHFRSNRRSLHLSLSSPAQQVVIIELADSSKPLQAGAAIIMSYKKSIRIYSIAVLPEFQGHGLGEKLINHIIEFAGINNFEKVSLEADAANKKLIQWYQKFGFVTAGIVEHYYAENQHAVKMMKKLLTAQRCSQPDRTIIVTNKPKLWDIPLDNTDVISPREYLTDQKYQDSERFRVLNLCNSYKNHTLGYYVSLLASARNHKISPSVIGIKDFSNVSIAQSLVDDIDGVLQKRFDKIESNEFELNIFFSDTPTPGFSDIAKKLSSLFEMPLFRISFAKNKKWRVKKIEALTFNNVIRHYSREISIIAPRYFQKKSLIKAPLKRYKYDLAILVNPEEATPPSCSRALNRLKDAAEKLGFFAEFITRHDYSRICEFDALFIRETTSVGNHTYKFARRAYTEGLVVMDDPWSILRCSNKIYLYERLARSGIKQPRSWQICKGNISHQFLSGFNFPLVLKMPESSFSMGVFKVNNSEEMREKLNLMFKTAELVIAQEFIETDFDWRIGVLDNNPLFACKYYMAQGHWQIYNWNNKDDTEFSGRSHTLPLDEVPLHILQTAVKASSLIGNGLYGVDLKDINGSACVIEINDNPNIDAGIEDAVLKEDLYARIMNSFLNRIEQERNIPTLLF